MKLVIGEYKDDYTGGTVVFTAHENNIKDFECNRLKVISDPIQSDWYRLGNEDIDVINRGEPVEQYYYKKEYLLAYLEENGYSQEFIDTLKRLDAKQHPHFYDNEVVRADWLNFEEKAGIYIVYVTDTDIDKEVVISDTYYCG